MTEHYIRADPIVWGLALAEHKAAQAAFDSDNFAGAEGDHEAMVEKSIASEARLLSTPAPDICAVIEKLNIVWEAELFSDTLAAEEKQMIIGDLRRLSAGA